VLTQPLFSWFEGSPETSFAKLRAQRFAMRFLQHVFIRFVAVKDSRGRAHEGPTDRLFHNFFDLASLGAPLASLGAPLERPGSPNDAPWHQHDTTMTPELYDNEIRILCKNDTRDNKQKHKYIEQPQENIQQPITLSGHMSKTVGLPAY
jgi:hypothetical protein